MSLDISCFTQLLQKHANKKSGTRINPNWPIKAFGKTVLKDLQIDFKDHILRKARRKCMRIINGTLEELWDYKSELLKRNPNSTVEIELDPVNDRTFRRMCICLGGLKHGFKLGCRKVLGFDGCHLKSAYKGQLLCAMGVDGNNCMCPLAYALVEAERLDSWRWFLALVATDLNIGSGEGWIFISDKQKGLLNVVDEMLPLDEHRYCVKHMHNNFKGKFGGRALKDRLWSCARASNVEAFQTNMNYMKEESEGAWKWLTEVPFHHWSRAHFRNDSKCDILLNNMCETFNRCILRAREQGVLVMLEMIREYLMRRLQNKRDEIEGWGPNKLTPKTLKLLDKYKKWSKGCYSTYAGYNEFEVTTVNESKYAVHIGDRTCGCRRWDLSGIPCHHGISCINRLGKNMEDYVDPVYSVERYEKTYSGIIFPMNGHSSWEKHNIFMRSPPPTVEKQPGRPTKKRRPEIPDIIEKEYNGVRILSKTTQASVRCGECHQVGHNRRTCPKLHPQTEAPIEPNPLVDVNPTDEEEIQETNNQIEGGQLDEHNEMLLDFPDEGPPMTQPSQTVNSESICCF
ncbi:uncharacterized protein LOC141702785 [Apium graveolens]|uniref:uncharacterized protein LOC141702785 n=1 Tax=Apium graveolens TaxID=4045 RepID=UPI003D7BA14F